MMFHIFVARWSSISHVFGDACKDAPYPIKAPLRAPLIHAKPGPTLKGAQTVQTALPSEDWLLMLLLLLVLDSLPEHSESQPELAPDS